MTVRAGGLSAVLVLAVGCASSGDVGSSTPSTTDAAPSSTRDTAPSPEVSPGVLDEFFESMTVRVLDADGVERVLCLWVADSDAERARGLMQVEDLEGADGMLFVYDRPTNSAFWMKDTLLPLSIAYFDADGRYVGSQDMEPCPPGTDCPVYPPPDEFLLAVEVPQGRLGDLSLASGHRIELGEPCDVSSG
jgi:uncharacterized membrane protein (UPF0127 family)